MLTKLAPLYCTTSFTAYAVELLHVPCQTKLPGPVGPAGPAGPGAPPLPLDPVGPCGPGAPWGPAGPVKLEAAPMTSVLPTALIVMLFPADRLTSSFNELMLFTTEPGATLSAVTDLSANFGVVTAPSTK